KPVGVWTGNDTLYVKSATSLGGGGRDSAHQQIAHVKALGHEYVGAGIITRMPTLEPESIPYRLVGVVDGTELSWDPAPPPNAPVTLAAGAVAEFETTEVFTVRSQDKDHPFAFSVYMPGPPGALVTPTRPGCSPTLPYGNAMCGLGDEEWV